MKLKRRNFIKTAVAAGSAIILPKVALATLNPKKKKRVIVIGGGFAGATAAKYISMWSADTEVIMIERNAQFISCPQSNLVLSGSRTLQQLTSDYRSLSDNYNIQTVQAEVVAIDTEKQNVTLADGVEISYHRLVIAPGVDFIYDDLPQLAHQEKIPHAWKAGHQTTLLKEQIKGMKKGGSIIMSIPGMPFRCPPGPYERACQIAFYLKQYNPTAKLIILDESDDVIVKKELFKGAWEEYYSGLIDYVPSSRIENIDIKTMQVETEFDNFSADVINFIPPQRAGKVAEFAGVINVDDRWCKVDFLSYESTVKKNVHIIGDAISASLPKSGHVANQQAKVCAAAIANLLNDQEVEQEPVFSNTCYSFVDNEQAGHIAEVFRYDKEHKKMKVMPNVGISDHGTKLDGVYANSWAKNIWADVLK